MNRVYIFLGACLLWGCGTDREECVFVPKVSPSDIQLSYERLEDTLGSFRSKADLVDFLSREPLIRDIMLRRQAYPDDSVFINEIFRRFNHPGIDTLLQETRAVFGDGSDLKEQFERAFANVKYYYPDFTPPKVKTLITGLDTDMYVSDSVVLISLDFFLGPGAKYRPQTYEYLLRRYDPHDIVPSVLLIFGIDNHFNQTDVSDKSVLADMVAYGKSFYFAKHMVPCTPDSILIWYTREEIEGAHRNQDLIWARLIEDQVLYSTSNMTKRAYLGDRPKTLEVGEKCPGRIGQWVGWEIVKAYMKRHPEVSLPELMATPDAQEIFKKSNYKPKVR